MAKKNRNRTAAASATKPDDEEESPMGEQEESNASPPQDEEEEFDIDESLIPEGLELEDLRPDFEPIAGFLNVPRLNKKTGEIYPPECTFAGILEDVVPFEDNRGKKRIWFVFTSTADQKANYLDDEGEIARVAKGDRIGVSGSGAISALKTKKGHFAYMHWTGGKVTVKNGDMWEVKVKVSKDPVKKATKPPFDKD